MIQDTGVVVRFDNRSGKMYGYIETPGKKKVWFHYRNGRYIRVNRQTGELYFSKRWVFLRIPHEGDKICFTECGDIEKPKAKPWSYESIYKKAFRKAERLNEPCPLCGHPMRLHNGNDDTIAECTMCACGTEAFEHEDEPLSTTPSWSTGPGGQEGYES